MKYLPVFILMIILAASCHNEYTPKPRGYYRIGFPEKSYTTFGADSLPYRFEIPVYATIGQALEKNPSDADLNITIPQNKADIHITYKKITGGNDELFKLLEDSRTLAYKHSIKADAIDERIFFNPQKKVYGTIYKIGGNVASPLQFYLTDSVKHFLRGAFYIREVPNIDSIKPVIDFLEPDIIHLIETTEWD